MKPDAPRSRRRPVRRLASRLLSRLLATPPVPLPGEPSSILVVRPDSRLGNLVLIEPLLRSLAERFPGAHLALLASDRFSDVLSGREWEIIRAAKADMARNPLVFARFASRLRSRGFEVAVDASHPFSFSLSGAIAAAISGAGVRIGFPSRGWGNWHTHLAPEPTRDNHESMSLHSLGSVWSGWPAWSRPRLDPGPVSGRSRAVGIHVGASRGKAYPEEKLSVLCRLLARIAPVEIYWGSEEERRLACRVAGDGCEISPRPEVRDLASRLSRLSVLVTPDNGPMHVASAAGVPVVALFRVPDQARFAPLSEGSEVLFDPAGPEPGIVLEAVERIMGRGGGSTLLPLGFIP